jgi:hypothetical protein
VLLELNMIFFFCKYCYIHGYYYIYSDFPKPYKFPPWHPYCTALNFKLQFPRLYMFLPGIYFKSDFPQVCIFLPSCVACFKSGFPKFYLFAQTLPYALILLKVRILQALHVSSKPLPYLWRLTLFRMPWAVFLFPRHSHITGAYFTCIIS